MGNLNILKEQIRLTGVSFLLAQTRAILNKVAPGPPPRPGLVWDEHSHRWIRPQVAGDSGVRESGGVATPVNDGQDEVEGSQQFDDDSFNPQAGSHAGRMSAHDDKLWNAHSEFQNAFGDDPEIQGELHHINEAIDEANRGDDGQGNYRTDHSRRRDHLDDAIENIDFLAGRVQGDEQKTQILRNLFDAIVEFDEELQYLNQNQSGGRG